MLLQTPEKEGKRFRPEEFFSRVSPPKDDAKSQREMRAALKFLRRLGHNIRADGEYQGDGNTSLPKISSTMREQTVSDWDSPEDRELA